MSKYIDPFIKNLPTIDLHGMDRVSARVATLDFINDNVKLKSKKIIIIHGIGEGILKAEVHNILKHNKNVLSYNLYYNNVGMTEVTLK